MPTHYDKASDNWWFYKTANVKYTFALLPRRCVLSGKLIWLEKCYKFTRMITGPGNPVYLYKWHNKHEHLIWQLKGRT